MKNCWKVDFYTTKEGCSPVEDFILSLPAKDQVKLLDVIQLLEDNGIYLRGPHSKSLTGHKGLFELRSKQGHDIQRVFYFHFVENTFVLLHGFTKKGQKTPEKEIQIALRRRKDYFERNRGSKDS